MDYSILIPAIPLLAFTAFAVWRGFEQEKRERKDK
jgi:hypothetical protein